MCTSSIRVCVYRYGADVVICKNHTESSCALSCINGGRLLTSPSQRNGGMRWSAMPTSLRNWPCVRTRVSGCPSVAGTSAAFPSTSIPCLKGCGVSLFDPSFVQDSLILLYVALLRTPRWGATNSAGFVMALGTLGVFHQTPEVVGTKFFFYVCACTLGVVLNFRIFVFKFFVDLLSNLSGLSNKSVCSISDMMKYHVSWERHISNRYGFYPCLLYYL